MNFSDAHSRSYRVPIPKRIFLLIIVLAATLGLGLIASNKPIMAIVAVVVAAVALAAFVWPDLVTVAVVFLLYTNAPAVAVQFHSIPYLVGAFVPMLLVIPLANNLVFHRQKLLFPKVLILIFLFYIVQVIGAFFSKDIGIATANLAKSFVEGILLYFLVINVVRTSEVLRRVIWALLAAGAIIGALGFYQLVTGTYDNNYGGFAQVSNAAFGTGQETLQGEVYQPRLAGSVGEQNRHAQVMLMLVPLGLFLIWGERNYLLRILAAFATALIALGAATTFSRGAGLAFVLMLLFMVFMRYIKFYQFALVILGLVLLLAVMPQYGTRLLRLQGLIGLIPGEDSSSTATTPDGALEGRTTSMLTAALVFADHPLVGVGPGMFGYYYQDYSKFVGPRWEIGNRQAHNLYLGIAAENGIIGLMIFMGLLFITLLDLSKTRNRWMMIQPSYAYIATGFLLAIVSYMATGIGLHLGYVRFFWLIMALAYVATSVSDKGSNSLYPLPNGLPYNLSQSDIDNSSYHYPAN